MALKVERQSARKSKTKNGRLASLASNPLVTVPILELLAKMGFNVGGTLLAFRSAAS